MLSGLQEAGWFAFGTLSFWFLLGFGCILLFFIVESRRVIFGLFSLLMMLLLFSFVGDMPVWSYIAHNPLWVLTLLGLQILLGIVWSYFKWDRFAKERSKEYARERTAFLARLKRHLESLKLGSDFTANDRRGHEIDRRGMEDRMFSYRPATEEERASFLQMISDNVIPPQFEHDFALTEARHMIAHVRNEKERIITWTIFWEWSFVWTFIREFMIKLFENIFETLRTSYQRVAHRHYRDFAEVKLDLDKD